MTPFYTILERASFSAVRFFSPPIIPRFWGKGLPQHSQRRNSCTEFGKALIATFFGMKPLVLKWLRNPTLILS